MYTRGKETTMECFEYKVRFHLQRGQHYMHWQIKAWDGTVKYIDPNKYQIEMYKCNLVNKTNGTGTSVSENEIIKGIRLLAETEGIFTETAGGVVIASLIKLSKQNKLSSEEKTVCLITGNGLKTPDVVSNLETLDIDSRANNLEEILSKV